LKNYETLKAFIQQQKTEVEYLNVQIYSMNTCIDYKLLINKLQSVKNKLELEGKEKEGKEGKEKI